MKFGNFNTIALLHPTSTGGVYSARQEGQPADSPATFVVKTFVPDRRLLGDAEAEAQIGRFLASAEMQQQAAAAATWTRDTEGGWAPIHEFGRFESESGAGAFSISDLARRGSCERLTGGAQKIDAAGLAHIVRQIAKTLIRLKAWTPPRPHGNLSVHNVLLMDDAAPSLVGVRLTDPLPPATAKALGSKGFAHDLRALGEIIYRLVMRREYTGGWPVADSPAWQALGRSGPKWLELCNALLDRSLQTGDVPALTIEQVVDRIPVERRRRAPLLIATAAVLVIAVGIAVFVLTSQRTLSIADFSRVQASPPAQIEKMLDDWARLVGYHEERKGWVDVLYRISADRSGPGLAKPEPGDAEIRSRLQRVATSLLGKAAVELKPEHRPLAMEVARRREGVLGYVPTADRRNKDVAEINALSANERAQLFKWWFVSDEVITSTGEALAAIDNLRAFLSSDDQWDAQRSVAEALAAMPDPDSELAQRLRARRVLLREAIGTSDRSALVAIADFAEIGAAARLVTDAARQLKSAATAAPNDPIAQTLSRRWATLVVPPGDSANSTEGAVLATRLGAAADLLARAAAATAAPAPKSPEILMSAMKAQGIISDAGPLTTMSEKNVEDWVTLRTGQHPALTAAEKLASVESAIDGLLKAGCGMPAAPEPVASSRNDVIAQVTNLLGQRVSDIGRAAVDAAGASAMAAADRLLADLRTRTQAAEENARTLAETLQRELRDFKPPSSMSSSAVVSAARSRLAGLADAAAIGACDKASERDAWLALFESFERQSAFESRATSDSAGWKRDLADLAADERERLIAAALSAITWSDRASAHQAAQTARAASIKSDITAWNAKLTELRENLAAMESRLQQQFSLQGGTESAAASWEKATQSELWRDARIQSAAAPVIALRNQHAKIESSSDAAELRQTIGRPEQPLSVRVAAWTRLTDALRPSWPSKSGDLSEVKALADSLVAANSTGAAQATNVNQLLSDGKRRTWLAFAERQASPAAGATSAAERAARATELQSALEKAAEFGVQSSDLPARVRVASLLKSLVTDLQSIEPRAGDLDARVESAWAALNSTVRSIGLDPAASAVWSTLAAAIDAEIADTKGGIRIEKLGPGALGFAGEVLDGGTQVRFTIFGEPVMFHQVMVGDIPWYLAESEVSVRFFSKVLVGAKKFDAAASEVWMTEQGQPRAWTLGSAGLTAAPAWIERMPSFDAYPAFGGGGPKGEPLVPREWGLQPTLDMPMQLLSEGGALEWIGLTGCQFPSLAAWKAAADLNARSGPPELQNANLRDQTFAAQFDHFKQVRDKTLPQNIRDNVAQDDFIAPDDLSYTGTSAEAAAAGAQAGSDGYLYFRKTGDDDPKRPFKNLIGNVAEFVRSDDGRVGMIGGSALSKVGQEREFRPSEVGVYFSDVGIRLAFTSAGAIKPPMNQAILAKLTAQLGTPPLLLQ